MKRKGPELEKKGDRRKKARLLSIDELEAKIRAMEDGGEENILLGGESGDSDVSPKELEKKDSEETLQARQQEEKEQLRCSVCRMQFSAPKQLVQHFKGSKHMENAAKLRGETIVKESKACCCRVCALKFSTLEQLLAHRKTKEHAARERLDVLQSFCGLCQKQFTSPTQLKEHEKGKWHKMRSKGIR